MAVPPLTARWDTTRQLLLDLRDRESCVQLVFSSATCAGSGVEPRYWCNSCKRYERLTGALQDLDLLRATAGV